MKFYRQIILLTLTLLVLVSSTGMAVGMHICGGELRDITFFGIEADCPMEKEKEVVPPCHAPKQAADDEACCEDHQVIAERLDVAAKHKALSFNKLQDLQLMAVIKAVVLQFYTSDADPEPRYALYESPPLVRDITVLVQSFLL
ncbi:HYC_CC_PP family protein [Pontibacter sp. H249]|uniref:HYC_CC_PP family protein n=1 Tax=Pontibacter sp. H249 TaxID=3133420 RepID=UPI0030BDD637